MTTRYFVTGLFMPTPPGGKRCTRPGRYSNPYGIRKDRSRIPKGCCDPIPPGVIPADAVEAVALFRAFLDANPAWTALRVQELRSYESLGCACQLDATCHVDVWLELLNG